MLNTDFPVVCLMGPTCTGKTSLSLKLVQKFPFFEIISVDSAMLYQGMDIGTAKPSPKILKKITHHYVSVHHILQPHSLQDFFYNVEALIHHIYKKRKIPLLVGGSMLYFFVMQNGLFLLPKSSSHLKGSFTTLKKIDPHTKIHQNDQQRIDRLCHIKMQRPSSPSIKKMPFRFLNISLIHEDKFQAWELLQNRLEEMFHQHFLEEAYHLYQHYYKYSPIALKAIGYQQACQHFLGQFNLIEMKEEILKANRRLMKHQKTWLKNKWKESHSFSAHEEHLPQKILETCLASIT